MPCYCGTGQSTLRLDWPRQVSFCDHALAVVCSCKKIMKTKGWPDPQSNSIWARDVSHAGCSRLVPAYAFHLQRSHDRHSGFAFVADKLRRALLGLACFRDVVLRRQSQLLAPQVAAIEGEILLVSQFTLYGRLKKPKPDYSKAMGPDQVLLMQAVKAPLWLAQPQALCICRIMLLQQYVHMVLARLRHSLPAHSRCNISPMPSIPSDTLQQVHRAFTRWPYVQYRVCVCWCAGA